MARNPVQFQKGISSEGAASGEVTAEKYSVTICDRDLPVCRACCLASFTRWSSSLSVSLVCTAGLS